MKKNLFILVFAFLASLSIKAQDINYEEWYMNTSDSVRIYVKELKSISNDTVIFVHGGFGANHDYMLDALKGLEKEFHFILYDQRGSLLSPAPIDKLTFKKKRKRPLRISYKAKAKESKIGLSFNGNVSWDGIRQTISKPCFQIGACRCHYSKGRKYL